MPVWSRQMRCCTITYIGCSPALAAIQERPMPESLLLVDDSRAIRTLVRRRLKNAGFVVCGEASDGMEALELATELSLDLVVRDFWMPRLSGLDAARVLRH